MDKEWIEIKTRIKWLKDVIREKHLQPDNSPGIEINAKIKWLSNQLRRLHPSIHNKPEIFHKEGTGSQAGRIHQP